MATQTSSGLHEVQLRRRADKLRRRWGRMCLERHILNERLTALEAELQEYDQELAALSAEAGDA